MAKLAINGGTPIGCGPFPSWPVSGEADIGAVRDVFENKYGDGYFCDKFAARFADYCDTPYCLPVANGTVSLELILRALGIGKGDEVILPPYTFIATLSSIIYAGATPVFADIERGTYNISAESAAKKITAKTKAVIAVAVAGRPADIDALEDLCKNNGLFLINDAAQAVGARWREKSIGSYGIATSFSCQNSKNLTGGEGGIITTCDKKLYDALRDILDINAKKARITRDFKINEYSAAMLDSQLDKLDGEIAIRSKNAAWLKKQLLENEYAFATDCDERIAVDAYHLFIIRFDETKLKAASVSRDKIIAAANAEGLPIGAGYAPLYNAPGIKTEIVRKIAGDIDLSPLPECERASYSEGSWLYQSCLLGNEAATESIYKIIEKITANITELSLS